MNRPPFRPRSARRHQRPSRSRRTGVKVGAALALAIALGIGRKLIQRSSEPPPTPSPLLPVAEALFDRAQEMKSRNDGTPDPSRPAKWKDAGRLFAQSAATFGQAGDVRRRARALHQQAWCLRPNRDPDGTWEETIRLFDEAARLSKASQDRLGWATSLLAKGQCLHPDENPAGNWAAALAIADEVIAYCRTDPSLQAELGDALHDRSWCLLPTNNPDAKDWTLPTAAAEEAERVQGGLPTRRSRLQRANSAFQQGWCWQPGHHPDGSWPRAIRHYEQALEVYVALDDAAGRADALRQLGFAWLDSESTEASWTRATGALRDAADLYGGLGNRREQARLLERLGRALRPDREPRGSWGDARAVYETLSTIYSDSEPWRLAEALFALALCRCEGDWKRATADDRAIVGRAEALLRESDDDERADEVASVLE